MPKCDTCRQPILPDEKYDEFQGEALHENPDDCVAAVVRRCVEIAEKRESKSNNDFAAAMARLIAKDIRREFGKAKIDETRGAA